MNCIIPGLNVKVLARAINALAKVGDELFIEAKLEKLTFVTFNNIKTICGQFHLLESFFSIYSVEEEHFNEKSAVSCKIHMKTILPILKGTQLEKKLEFIKIQYKVPDDFIKFKVKYKTDEIVITHVCCLLDPESFTMDDYSGPHSNNICGDSTFFSNLLTVFSSSDDDITFEVGRAKMAVRNYCMGAPPRPKSVRSQVNLSSSEFSLYKILEETTINFSLKPFRTAVLFAETFNLFIGIDFDKGGGPLTINIKNPTFMLLFIVSTINPYTDGQSTIATTSLPAKITQVQMNGSQHELTHEDISAIANENWDEFDSEMDNIRKSSKKDKNFFKSTNQSKLEKSRRNTSRGLKKFSLLDGDNNISTDITKTVCTEADCMTDFVPKSPESPRTKKAKLIFKRSYDQTFHASVINNVLLHDSDSE